MRQVEVLQGGGAGGEGREPFAIHHDADAAAIEPHEAGQLAQVRQDGCTLALHRNRPLRDRERKKRRA